MVEYNAQSIETLSFRDAIRSRVAMYMGSADNMGVLQCLREIITNSIDEATMGFGKRITVDLYKDNRVRIGDEGRGCPFGKRDDGTEQNRNEKGADEKMYRVRRAPAEEYSRPSTAHS